MSVIRDELLKILEKVDKLMSKWVFFACTLIIITRFKNIILNTYNIIPNIMSRLALTILAALLLTAVVCEEDKYRGPSEEDVIVLDADTLEPTIYES